MKTNIVLLSLALSLPATMTAFAHPSPEPGARIIETLQLDEGRAEEVKQIMTAFHEKRETLQREVRQEMKALRQEQQTQLEAILTEEEMAALKQIRSEKRQHHKTNMHEKRLPHNQH